MRPRKFTTIRKKAETVVEDNRFKHTLRLAKERARLRTEYARLHGLYFEQITPQLRARVMQDGRDVAERYRNLI